MRSLLHGGAGTHRLSTHRSVFQETFGTPLTWDDALRLEAAASRTGRVEIASAIRRRRLQANQYAVVDTLAVRTSAKYRPDEWRETRREVRQDDGSVRVRVARERDTYCNAYAGDLIRALGGQMAGGSVNDGLMPALERGGRRGREWRRLSGPDEAQSLANDGRLVIAAAAGTKHSGHVTVVLAEREGAAVTRGSETPHVAARSDGDSGPVTHPLMSQAGGVNAPFYNRPQGARVRRHRGRRRGSGQIPNTVAAASGCTRPNSQAHSGAARSSRLASALRMVPTQRRRRSRRARDRGTPPARSSTLWQAPAGPGRSCVVPLACDSAGDSSKRAADLHVPASWAQVLQVCAE